jgi:Pentapeptide repeats (8 copies)
MSLSLMARLAAFLNAASWFVPVVSVIALVIGIGVPAWLFLRWYIKPDSSETRKDVVSLLLQTLGGVAFVLGGWFTWQQLINSREELQNSREALITTQQGQITERFTRAIEQLGKSEDGSAAPGGAPGGSDKNLAVRLGGIYALERLSKDSKTDYPAVMEVLTAFVRQHALWTGGAPEATVRPDIQAILSVLGRRERSYGQGENQRLDLSATDLRGALLADANLSGANLKLAHFENANLSRARLNGAQLSGARFNENSVLTGASLRDCDLRGASLKGADVTDADFTEADLTGVDLREAKGLTSGQVNSAKKRDGMLVDL